MPPSHLPYATQPKFPHFIPTTTLNTPFYGPGGQGVGEVDKPSDDVNPAGRLPTEMRSCPLGHADALVNASVPTALSNDQGNSPWNVAFGLLLS